MANIFGRDDIIRLLDTIRNKLLGNAVVVQEMAFAFAQNNTLDTAREKGVNAAVQAVSGTWSGRAADQFTTYANRVSGTLDHQQNAVASMSENLVKIAQCVITTYESALELVGTCASELAKIGIKGVLAALTVEIPIADFFTAKDVIDTVIDAFSTLVDKIGALFAKSVTTLGDFAAGSISLQQSATNFPELPEMPGNSGMNNEKQWRVNPTAFPE
ncbi:WXG100 family type VII secretion target [Amycolatopsis sp. NBC_00345]|uniref:WXG100 family type VII secretion target n=1 Tax=Amycolatopsis sp. NBC_00345 TaxID=2975955 RepID=UPI002E2586D6